MSSYLVGLLSLGGMEILAAFSVYATLRTGQLSLGNGGFMAVGAYVSALLTVHLHWPLPAALLAGGLAAAALGVVVGFPALRLHGIYLAMATVGFGEMVRTFFLNFEATGGALGMRGMAGTTPGLIWACVTAAAAWLWLEARSRRGMAARAVRDDELAAAFAGLNVTRVKIAAFGEGAFLAGVAGGLHAHYNLYIEPNMFGFSRSIEMVLAVILGGMDTLWGGALGAVLLTGLPELLRFLRDWRGAFFGALLVVLLMFRPRGLLGDAPPLGRLLARDGGATAAR